MDISNSLVHLVMCVPNIFLPGSPTEMCRFQVIKESADLARSCVSLISDGVGVLTPQAGFEVYKLVCRDTGQYQVPRRQPWQANHLGTTYVNQNSLFSKTNLSTWLLATSRVQSYPRADIDHWGTSHST